MTRKAADLRHAMLASAKASTRQTPTPVDTAARAVPPPTYPENPHYRPGRAHKTNVTGYFPPAVKKQLRMLAAEHDTTIQALLAEAMNDLFAKYGKPEIAPIAEKE
jgi:hypothetical protein